MDQKISHVSELVRKFDGSSSTSRDDCSTLFTRAVENDMRLMHDKFANIYVKALADMYTKIQVIDTQVEGSILHALQPVYE